MPIVPAIMWPRHRWSGWQIRGRQTRINGRQSTPFAQSQVRKSVRLDKYNPSANPHAFATAVKNPWHAQWALPQAEGKMRYTEKSLFLKYTPEYHPATHPPDRISPEK